MQETEQPDLLTGSSAGIGAGTLPTSRSDNAIIGAGLRAADILDNSVYRSVSSIGIGSFGGSASTITYQSPPRSSRYRCRGKAPEHDELVVSFPVSRHCRHWTYKRGKPSATNGSLGAYMGVSKTPSPPRQSGWGYPRSPSLRTPVGRLFARKFCFTAGS